MASNTYNIKIASVPTKGRVKSENGVPANSGGGSNSLLIVNEDIKNLFNEFFEKDGDLIKVKKEMYCVGGVTAFGDGTVGGGSGGGSGTIASASDALFTNLATGQLMKYNGTHWVNVSQSEITPTFDNLQGKPANFPTNTDNVSGLTGLFSALKIENLADVSLVTKANNHYLGWNGTKFVNRQIAYAEISGIPTIPANGSFSFSGLNDVQIVTPVTGNFARWNGTKWVNAMLSASDIPTHAHAGATTAANGFMSAADKMKLDGIAASANNYVHPNDANTRHVTDAEKTTWNGKYDPNNCNRTNVNWTCNILQATGIQCGHNVVNGITTDGFDSRLPSHFYRNCYDADGNVYDHYYNSAFKGINSQANLRVKSGAGFKVLAFNGNGGFAWDDKVVYHAGNSNRADVSWTCSSLLASGEITAYSDRRLKENIIPIESAIEKVEQLNPVRYDKDGKESIGLIAQEVKEIYPEFVLGKETEDEYLSLNYAQMNAVLIKALQEISAEVKELKSRLNSIENGI